MNPAETIAAAITKLTELRDRPELRRTVSVNQDDTEDMEFWSRVLEIIDRNRRTVDAQLELLTVALEYGDLQVGRGSRFVTAAQNLARAIVEAGA